MGRTSAWHFTGPFQSSMTPALAVGIKRDVHFRFGSVKDPRGIEPFFYSHRCRLRQHRVSAYHLYGVHGSVRSYRYSKAYGSSDVIILEGRGYNGSTRVINFRDP